MIEIQEIQHEVVTVDSLSKEIEALEVEKKVMEDSIAQGENKDERSPNELKSNINSLEIEIKEKKIALLKLQKIKIEKEIIEKNNSKDKENIGYINKLKKEKKELKEQIKKVKASLKNPQTPNKQVDEFRRAVVLGLTSIITGLSDARIKADKADSMNSVFDNRSRGLLGVLDVTLGSIPILKFAFNTLRASSNQALAEKILGILSVSTTTKQAEYIETLANALVDRYAGPLSQMSELEGEKGYRDLLHKGGVVGLLSKFSDNVIKPLMNNQNKCSGEILANWVLQNIMSSLLALSNDEEIRKAWEVKSPQEIVCDLSSNSNFGYYYSRDLEKEDVLISRGEYTIPVDPNYLVRNPHLDGWGQSFDPENSAGLIEKMMKEIWETEWDASFEGNVIIFKNGQQKTIPHTVHRILLDFTDKSIKTDKEKLNRALANLYNAVVIESGGVIVKGETTKATYKRWIKEIKKIQEGPKTEIHRKVLAQFNYTNSNEGVHLELTNQGERTDRFKVLICDLYEKIDEIFTEYKNDFFAINRNKALTSYEKFVQIQGIEKRKKENCGVAIDKFSETVEKDKLITKALSSYTKFGSNSWVSTLTQYLPDSYRETGAKNELDELVGQLREIVKEPDDEYVFIQILLSSQWLKRKENGDWRWSVRTQFDALRFQAYEDLNPQKKKDTTRAEALRFAGFIEEWACKFDDLLKEEKEESFICKCKYPFLVNAFNDAYKAQGFNVPREVITSLKMLGQDHAEFNRGALLEKLNLFENLAENKDKFASLTSLAQQAREMLNHENSDRQEKGECLAKMLIAVLDELNKCSLLKNQQPLLNKEELEKGEKELLGVLDYMKNAFNTDKNTYDAHINYGGTYFGAAGSYLGSFFRSAGTTDLIQTSVADFGLEVENFINDKKEMLGKQELGI